MAQVRAFVLMACVTMVAAASSLFAQYHKGDIVGSAGYSATSYSGEFESDGFGDGGLFTLSYNTSDRFRIVGRLGFGSYAWQTNATLMKKYSDYYGANAQSGGNYPGTLTKIEARNRAGLTTFDVVGNYALMVGKAITPYVSAGIGMVHFTPTNTSEHSSLPNFDRGVYPATVVSLPLGAGILVPIADQLSLNAQYDYRVVMSGYLDDYEVKGVNDGLSQLSIGISYQFNEPSRSMVKGRYWCEQCKTWYDETNCAICEIQNCEICANKARKNPPQDLAYEAPAPPPPPAPEPAPVVEPKPVKPVPPPELEPVKEKRKLTAQGIRFRVNSEQIDFTDPATRSIMDEMLEYMTESCDELQVLIEGHASVDGPPARNKELSVLRAREVAKWLIENGVPSEKIKGSVGYGSSMPKVPDPPPAAIKRMTKQQLEAIREQNRRIELSILKDCE